MKPNVGTIDRSIRIIAAIVLITLYAVGILSGTLGLVLAILGVVLGITGLVRFCGVYAVLGINTCCSGDSSEGCSCCKK